MIAAVLDVNALASATIGVRQPNSTPGDLLRRWQRDAFELVLSQHIVDGLQYVLSKPYFTARLTTEQARSALAEFHERARFVSVTDRVVGVAPNDEDDQVLAAAVSAGVRYLVTGDAAFLRLGRYREVELLTPRAFLELLRAAESDDTVAST